VVIVAEAKFFDSQVRLCILISLIWMQILKSRIPNWKTILSLFTFTRKCYYWCTGFNISAECYQIFILYNFAIISIVYFFYFIIVMQLKKSHNSSFTDPDARNVGILFIITSSNRVWAIFQLVPSWWALVSSCFS
jgi:hypothetical protein